jgi:hypothetical protein
MSKIQMSRYSDMRYQLLEIMNGEARVYAVMTGKEFNDFVVSKYREQPIQYFNIQHRLYIIEHGDHVIIRPLSVKVEL